MIENIVLGMAQGVAEWLPLSSDGIISLIKINVFGGTTNLEDLTKLALFLHLGTFLAALIYFRRDVWRLLKALFNYKKSEITDKIILKFLIISTLISGIFGVAVIKISSHFAEKIGAGAEVFGITIGLLLIITAIIQIKNKHRGSKMANDLKPLDYVLCGLAQGLAPLPGLSRSGLTVSSMLFRGFDKNEALRLSFLMSLPIILGGNLLLLIDGFKVTFYSILGVLVAFVVGMLTIDLLLKVAKKINFGYFVLIIGCLTIIAAVLIK